VIDERYQLCTALPPVWLATPALAKLRLDLESYEAGEDVVVAAVAALYARSAARGLGAEAADLPELPDHIGVEMLGHIINCGDPSDEVREQSRNWLARAEATLPAFGQAWGRFAMGVSLLSESGVVRQQRGLVNLLHLPALHHETQPYLAGIALSLAAAALEAQGDADAAHVLLADLTSQYPNHPVLAAPLAGQQAPAPPVEAPAEHDSLSRGSAHHLAASKETS
jgi:hypothetical protein